MTNVFIHGERHGKWNTQFAVEGVVAKSLLMSLLSESEGEREEEREREKKKVKVRKVLSCWSRVLIVVS